jgi:catechol 2,3-dioxygenase-like lactoylglutathione lyase family enzyme
MFSTELEAGLVARDLEALGAFYTSVMGFQLVDRFDHAAGTVCKLRRGHARLKLFSSAAGVDPVAETEPWYRPGGWRYAALYLDAHAAVDALATAMAAAGGRVLIAPVDHRPGARMALVTDPEGNAWEVLAEA